MTKVTSHTSEYGPEYYETYGRLGPCAYTRENQRWLEFFEEIATQIVRSINPKRVLDVGCGKGFLVESLRDRGVEAYGFDISEYAIGEVRADVRPYCWVAPVTAGIKERYDLITCIEVCEHLSQDEAAQAVRQMTIHSDAILFSSTPSNFSEPTHVNVRPIIDWLRLFSEFSFAPDDAFDTAFVAPQAILFRRAQSRPSDRSLCRFAEAKNRAVAFPDISRLQARLEAREAQLEGILRSREWKLVARYRGLRFRIKHPIALLIQKFRTFVDPHLSYDYWIKHVERRSYDAGRAANDIGSFRYKPTISVVMPVYNTPPGLLDLAIQSVRAQDYENWELCICDDASPNPGMRETLEKWQARDARIKVTYSGRNEGISGASNRALQLATGEFVALLDHDDELSPNALYEVVKLLNEHPEADMIYSDEDHLDANGQRVRPIFKPDWSPEYMLAQMYTCHLGVYRKGLLDEIGGFRLGFDGSQDYDLVLRVSERTTRIHHIAKILYHWRMAPGSVAASNVAKPYAYVAAKRALSEHLTRRDVRGEIIDGRWRGQYRVSFALETSESVSIVVAGLTSVEALRACVSSVETESSYPDYEIIVVRPKEEGAIGQCFSPRVRSVPSGSSSFNSSNSLNLGATHATGDYILFLHEDTQVISPQWITSMLGFCRQKYIGAVGAKLLYTNGRIQHAGMVLGLKGVVGYPLRGLPRDWWEAGNGASCASRNCSAVSAACMMVRKNVFEEVGGFDEMLSAPYSEVDFCLKVRKLGYRIVWTPWAELYHDESSCSARQNGSQQEAYLKKRWGKALQDDPYYNPNLTLRHEDLGYRI